MNVIANSSVLFKSLSVVNGSVWACGSSAHAASCSLANAVTGKLSTQFEFPWDTITSAIVTSDNTKIMVSGRTVNNAGVITSEVATCSVAFKQLSCAVKSFASVDFFKASYNAYGQKFVYAGQNADRAAVSLFDANNNSVRSFVYSAASMSALTLSHVESPPNFVGSFVAGTSVSSGAVAAKNIVAGWLRTDSGQMAATIGITPVSGSIVSTTGLVNALALEEIGPDSFIAGRLHLSDSAGAHAYVVRANSLYRTAQFGVRYVPQITQQRRQLSTTNAVTSSVARGLALSGGALFMIADVVHVNINRTSLAVLKIHMDTGAVIKQAVVSAPSAD